MDDTGTDTKACTYKKRPLKLVFQEPFMDVNHAIAFEKQVKGWSRAKKEAIMNGNRELLPQLSKGKKVIVLLHGA